MLERDYMETEVKEEVKTEKKSKKGLLITLIVICAVLFVGLSSLLTYLIINKDKHVSFIPVKKITITFNVDGGTKVEKITFKKGTFVELPSSTKEGYEFKGWIVEKLNKNSKEFYEVGSPLSDYWTKFLEDDITVKANWEALGSDKKSMTLYFDAKGGTISGNNSNTSQSVVKCDDDDSYTVEGLPTVTKEGYSFVAWVDSHETPILTGAKLVCEDINLYANWNKEDENWTCEGGETPDANHKCTSMKSSYTKCPETDSGKRVVDNNGTCVRLTGSDRIDYNMVCKKEMITIYSSAQYEDGKVVDWGVKGCAYHKTDDTKSTCESHGYKWVTPENACYVKWVQNNTDNSCPSGYSDVINPNSFSGVNGLNSGCYPIVNRERYCDAGYELKGETCVKTYNAKKVN